uniref:Uncharacterized protein n=1 Tax=Chlamydomonas leiostraca TaxID=1034604 RepID=A0A7S0S167_9CHLO
MDEAEIVVNSARDSCPSVSPHVAEVPVAEAAAEQRIADNTLQASITDVLDTNRTSEEEGVAGATAGVLNEASVELHAAEGGAEKEAADEAGTSTGQDAAEPLEPVPEAGPATEEAASLDAAEPEPPSSAPLHDSAPTVDTAALAREAAAGSQDAAAEAGPAPAAQDAAASQAAGTQEEQGLELVVWPDEAVSYSQLGHLITWASGTRKVNVSIPPAASMGRVVDTIRLAWNFKQLTDLQITPVAATWRVNQAVLGAGAELLGLRSLVLDGGTLDTRGLNLHALTSLRALSMLRLRPLRGGEMGDELLVDSGLAYLTTLQDLEFRGCLDTLTDEGLEVLHALSHINTLAIHPIGLMCSRVGMEALCAHLPGLRTLHIGVSQAGQAEVLRGAPDTVKTMSLVVSGGCHEGRMAPLARDPRTGSAVHVPGPAELPALLASCTLCYAQQLVSLRLATIRVEDSTFMVALGTLTRLTELSVAVGPARRSTPPAILNLSHLSQLRTLKALDFAAVGQRLALPLTPKLMAVLTASWPTIQSLSLSAMVPMPGTTASSSSASSKHGGCRIMNRAWSSQLGDALSLLGQFSELKKLALFAPLSDEFDDVGGDESDWGDDGSSSEEGSESGYVSDDEGSQGLASPAGTGELGHIPPADAFADGKHSHGTSSTAASKHAASGKPPRPVPVAVSAGHGVAVGRWSGDGAGRKRGGKERRARLVPVHLNQLPAGLRELVLERARVRLCPPSKAGGARGLQSKGSVRRSMSGQGVPAAPTPWGGGVGAADGEAVEVLVQEGAERDLPGANARAALWSRRESGSGGGSFTAQRVSASGASLGGSRDVSGVDLAGGAAVEVPVTALLKELSVLELSSCWARDSTLTTLFTTAHGLTRLELNEVRGASGATIAALTGLTNLRHLEVVDASKAPSPAATAASTAAAAAAASSSSSGGGWLGALWSVLAPAPPSSQQPESKRASHTGSAAPKPPAAITNAALAHVGHLTTLRHLQWAVGDAAQPGSGAHPRTAARVLRALQGSLQSAYIYTARPEEGAEAGGQWDPYAFDEDEEGAGSEGSYLPGGAAGTGVSPRGTTMALPGGAEVKVVASGAPAPPMPLHSVTGRASSDGGRRRVSIGAAAAGALQASPLLHPMLLKAAGPLCLLEAHVPVMQFNCWNNTSYYEHT